MGKLEGGQGRTSDGGQDLFGRFSQQCIAEDDGIFADLGRIDDAGRNCSRCHRGRLNERAELRCLRIGGKKQAEAEDAEKSQDLRSEKSQEENGPKDVNSAASRLLGLY